MFEKIIGAIGKGARVANISLKGSLQRANQQEISKFWQTATQSQHLRRIEILNDTHDLELMKDFFSHQNSFPKTRISINNSLWQKDESLEILAQFLKNNKIAHLDCEGFNAKMLLSLLENNIDYLQNLRLKYTGEHETIFPKIPTIPNLKSFEFIENSKIIPSLRTKYFEPIIQSLVVMPKLERVKIQAKNFPIRLAPLISNTSLRKITFTGDSIRDLDFDEIVEILEKNNHSLCIFNCYFNKDITINKEQAESIIGALKNNRTLTEFALGEYQGLDLQIRENISLGQFDTLSLSLNSILHDAIRDIALTILGARVIKSISKAQIAEEFTTTESINILRQEIIAKTHEILFANLDNEQLIDISRKWHSPEFIKKRNHLKDKRFTWESLFRQKEMTIPEQIIGKEGWTIKALTNSSQLKIEGGKLQHCVGSYGSKCFAGNAHIFSVRNAQNEPISTIEFTIADDMSQIQAVQHFGKNNTSPDLRAKLALNYILDQVYNGTIDINCQKITEHKRKYQQNKDWVGAILDFDITDEKTLARIKKFYGSIIPERAMEKLCEPFIFDLSSLSDGDIFEDELALQPLVEKSKDSIKKARALRWNKPSAQSVSNPQAALEKELPENSKH